MTPPMTQLNVRLDRGLKERGDATLSLAGSSPAKIIRQLWELLASGGDAYERVMEVLRPDRASMLATDPSQRVLRSASLFTELGTTLGADLPAFEPDLRPTSEILEEAEWELLQEGGLA